MTRLHLHRTSFLQTSFFKNLLLSSILLPQFLLAGCVVGLDEAGGLDDEAGDCEEAGPALVPTFLHDPSREGLVQSALTAAGATFVTDDFQAVIINVDGSDAATLAPVVTFFLDEGKQIVLDSSGGDAERVVIGEIAGAVTGLAAREAALSIIEDTPGAFVVTPIDTAGQFDSSDDDASGNTPLKVLASGDAEIGSTCPTSDDAPQTFASDTTTRRSYQGRNKPAPRRIPVLVDNNAIHHQTHFSGSEERRYLFVGDPQYCPLGTPDNCSMSWGESYSKSIAHSTKIDVSFSNAFTEALTGGVTIGYSLTVTNSRTLSWSNRIPVAPGYSARPVSYVLRRTGHGKVKNAYIFQSRRKIHSPCRPSGGCYSVIDTYVRERNTEVGTWIADVALNEGRPTNSWVVFRGERDPNLPYKMDN